MKRAVKKILGSLVLVGFFLLPFFGWISAEPAPYRDPEGAFSIVPPTGWKSDSSQYMGKGVILKGPAGESGVEPVVHLLREPAGIVTLDVQWHTHLGRLRYEMERVKFIKLEDFEEQDPPSYQALYTYADGERSYQALARIILHGGHFYLLTASSLKEEFGPLRPLFEATFDSLRVAQGD